MRKRVQASSKKFWSDEEVLILRTMFPAASCYECLQALPGRSWSAIKNMGRYLGIDRKTTGRGVGKCLKCGEVRQVGHSCAKYPGLCRECAGVSRKPARMRIEVEAEATDRSLEEMRATAKKYDQGEMLPEIADLCNAELRIIQQLGMRKVDKCYLNN